MPVMELSGKRGRERLKKRFMDMDRKGRKWGIDHLLRPLTGTADTRRRSYSAVLHLSRSPQRERPKLHNNLLTQQTNTHIGSNTPPIVYEEN